MVIRAEGIIKNMLRFFASIFRSIFSGIRTLVTGGKFGDLIPSPHSYNYSKAQEQKRKDFEAFGGHPCKICNTRIPANKSYCGACYFKYVKK